MRLTYDDERRKANLFATLGDGKPDGVILSGHTDTVPWDGQAWTREPLGAEVQDGRLYGRGSADMKGFIGLVVAQTQALPRRGPAARAALRLQLRRGGRLLRRAAPDRRPARGRRRAAPVHRRRADRHGAGHRAQGRLPLALLRQGQAGAFVADAAGRQRHRGRRARWSRTSPTWATTWRDGRAALRRLRRALHDGRVGVDSRAASPTTWCRRTARFHYEFRNLPGTDVLAHAARACTERGALRAARCRRSTPAPASASRRSAPCPASWRATDEPAVRTGAAAERQRRRRRWSPSAPRPACSSAPASPRSCAAPASSTQAHQPDEFV